MRCSGKICAESRIKFYKVRRTCYLCDSPGADTSELQKVKQEEHDWSYDAEDTCASNAAIWILMSSLQAVGELPVMMNYLQEK
jgi:hypothetical protein